MSARTNSSRPRRRIRQHVPRPRPRFVQHPPLELVKQRVDEFGPRSKPRARISKRVRAAHGNSVKVFIVSSRRRASSVDARRASRVPSRRRAVTTSRSTSTSRVGGAGGGASRGMVWGEIRRGRGESERPRRRYDGDGHYHANTRTTTTTASVKRAHSLGDVFGRRSDVGVEELAIPFEQPFAEGVIDGRRGERCTGKD